MERKSSAYLNSDDMFSIYAQKTYIENIPCELALNLSFTMLKWGVKGSTLRRHESMLKVSRDIFKSMLV